MGPYMHDGTPIHQRSSLHLRGHQSPIRQPQDVVEVQAELLGSIESFQLGISVGQANLRTTTEVVRLCFICCSSCIYDLLCVSDNHFTDLLNSKI